MPTGQPRVQRSAAQLVSKKSRGLRAWGPKNVANSSSTLARRALGEVAA
jgi:hypothetical protein